MANVLTNAGRAIATNLVTVLGGTAPNYMAIGSAAGTAAVADTTLFTEYVGGTWTGYARVNTTPTRITTSVTNDTAKWSGTFTAGAAQTVTNAGNFDAVTTGNLFIKGDFTGVVLANGDSITINITWQLS